jgi:hypothetical protein
MIEPIKLHVTTEQVEVGREYKGRLQFDDIAFLYRIQFDYDFSELESIMTQDIQAARDGIHVTATDLTGVRANLDYQDIMALFAGIYEGISRFDEHRLSRGPRGIAGIRAEEIGLATIKLASVDVRMNYPKDPLYERLMRRYTHHRIDEERGDEQ